MVTELQNALASAARVFELIDEEPQVPEEPDAAVLGNAKGEISLEHVYFSYNPEVALIEDMNLNVRKGQRVAIVGPTGCGKSTVINLLMRFYDVDSGSIRVDGTDIRHMTRQSLRTSYGMVLQETWLKSGTIRENIAYGKPDADEEEIILAAKELMPTVLSGVCRKDMIPLSRKTAEIYPKARSSFYALPELCCAFLPC